MALHYFSRRNERGCITARKPFTLLNKKSFLCYSFYLLYGWDYLKGVLKYKNKQEAYFKIRFEQEAYEHMFEEEYLQDRQKYAWKKYKV